MGFFGRTKSKEEVEPEAGAPTPESPGSDISDDYVAPDIEAAEEASGKEEGETEPKAEAMTGDGEAAAAEAGGEETSAPAERGETTTPTGDGTAATADALDEKVAAPAATSAASLSNSMNGDAYVNAGAAEKQKSRASPVPTEDYVRIDEAASFNGAKGTVQPPGYRDVKYGVVFLLHFAFTAWWFIDSFRQKYYSYYVPTKHAGLASFTFATSLAGLGLAFLTFGYMLNHSETVLKATAVFGTAMWLVLCLLGLIAGEYLLSVVGLLAFAAAGVYVHGVWERIPFISINLSSAIAAVTENEGLFAAALLVAAEGYIWLAVAIPAAVSANKYYGSWTMVIMAFSYYWTHQVMTNVLAVGTAGTVGRWLVIGEGAPTVTTGLKETFARVKTYSFGSICFGSLFFGVFHMIQGFSRFLSSKKVPILPGLLEKVLTSIDGAFGKLNQWAYIYVGLYGYSYTAAAQNSTELLHNKGWDGLVLAQLSTNVLFMVNVAIGLLTGMCGLMFGAYEYRTMWTSGFMNPASDGFFVGFLVGFLMSSIMLSVVTATLNTLVVCLAESPDEFKTNHPEVHEELAGAWKTTVESIPEECTP